MRRRKKWFRAWCRSFRQGQTLLAVVVAVRRSISARSGRRWTNMITKLCDVNAAASEKLPPHSDDKSGIGVHYVDAYIKPMNVKLEDGAAVKCKRRGLKIVFSAGSKKGEGLMRRVDVSKDPVVMLDAALQEAANGAGVELSVENEVNFIT